MFFTDSVLPDSAASQRLGVFVEDREIAIIGEYPVTPLVG
jgi:hypothetical protein